MQEVNDCFRKIKKDYFKFILSQETKKDKFKNKENTPIPSNSDIKILNIKGGYYAVIKYSGRAYDKNFTKHKGILEKELKKDDISILSPPIKATYDGPFTLPMNRRNEVMFEINIKIKEKYR